jgi:hypothetical protein
VAVPEIVPHVHHLAAPEIALRYAMQVVAVAMIAPELHVMFQKVVQ